VAAAIGDVRTSFAASLDRIEEAGAGPQLAGEYMLGPDVLYLNHASIGTVPRAVQDAHTRYLEICESNPHVHIWGDVWQEPRERVRSKAAALLGCSPNDVALTHNTTEGFNTLAHGLSLEPGDEVLFSSLNHGGASAPWQHHGQRRGYSVRRFEFPIADVPSLSAADVVRIHLEAIRDETRVLVFPHVDNIVGLRHPVRELVRGARERGVEFVAVDVAQSLGMIDVDVIDSDVDFLAASPHKWVQAPKGSGLLYMKSEHKEQVRPLWVTAGQAPRGTIRVFEDYGTRDSPGLLALGDALDFQQRLGAQAKQRRYREVRQRMRDAVDASPRLRWLSPTDQALSSSLYLIEFTGRRSSEVLTATGESDGVVFRAFRTQGLDGGRISPNVVTSDEQITRFLSLVGA
jgi:selenocysteine lyase/cysteine desulfurase